MSFISLASYFDTVLVAPVVNGHSFAHIFILHDLETKSVDQGLLRQTNILIVHEEKKKSLVWNPKFHNCVRKMATEHLGTVVTARASC